MKDSEKKLNIKRKLEKMVYRKGDMIMYFKVGDIKLFTLSPNCFKGWMKQRKSKHEKSDNIKWIAEVKIFKAGGITDKEASDLVAEVEREINN